MLAPLRFNFCFLCTAPVIFRCHAHPLGGDDLSISGRSETTHSVGARDRPPGYSSNPDEENARIVLNAEDADDNDASRFTFQVESISEVDEEAGTAKLNGNKDVLLKANPRELGVNDAEGLSRKYYIVDPNHAPDELENQAVLKIVDLLEAEKFGEDVVDDLTVEGYYWNQGEGLMLLWESEEPVEKKDSHGKVVKRDHMIIHRATRSGIPLQDESGDMRRTKLKFIGEWVTEWDSRGKMDDMLAKCKESAMKTHKRLAEKKMQINDYDLNKWVTDESCDYWLPNEINVAFDAKDGAREVSVKGGDDLELERGDYEAYFEKVKEELDREFTAEAIEAHRNRLSEIPARA